MVMISISAKAQSTADSVYNRYLDFNLEKLQGNLTKELNMGESLLPDADKLSVKSRTSFYNGMAKVYEEYHQADKAIRYYELVVAAEPDYYVAHRALGYLYADAAADLYKKMKGTTDNNLLAAYKNTVLKVLPYLEKAQACDPDNDTLKLIQMLYTNINDNQGLNLLNNRLTELKKHCEDILSE
jgi:hypothetical protein